MGRFPDDQDAYDTPLQSAGYDAAAGDGDEDEDEPDYDDTRVPVLDDIVTPGPGIAPPEPVPPLDPLQAERLHGLVREAVDLALDDALDSLRTELHARLRDHLDERLPQLIAEALRERDGD